MSAAQTALRAAIPRLHNEALAAFGAGDLGRAGMLCQQVLAADPRHADALNLLGVVLRAQGHLLPALDLADRAIRVRPREAAYHVARGDTLEALGRMQEAEAAWREAVRLDPRCVPALANLGDAAFRAKDYAQAAGHHRRALAVDPHAVPALNGLATALQQQGQSEEAERQLRTALRLAPNQPILLNNLANLMRDTGRLAEAESLARQALALAPGHPRLLHGLALTHCAAGRLDAAETLLNEVLAAHPEDAEAHHALSIALLVQGRFPEGLEHYEWRGEGPPAPNWDGANLAGRTLLVLADEGYGDWLHYARLIPWAARQGRVVVQVPPPLVRLAMRLPGIARIVGGNAPPPPHDLRCSANSLMRAARITLETIPAEVPYLEADPADLEAWAARLAPLAGLRVGLCWAGNPGQSVDALRSIPPALLAPLAEVPGVAFVSLQPRAPTDAIPGLALHAWDDELLDFADTAALVAQLDLVIAVDTAVAHLAGALGRPVWMLNRWDGATDPRWLLAREDSPWYPTMRIFRQQARGDWQGVIARVQAALRERVGG